ncbi:MAG: NAD(P)/FAD-dependent oxidoreductase [Jiangellaceae bacterium]|nr:NAD(P)/FAD-dependent oxidoreductase [Jiangellaceae bacterium]
MYGQAWCTWSFRRSNGPYAGWVSEEVSAERVERDLLMVGAGPVGLYAAYYAGFRGLSSALVDSLPEPGGQITAMYPEKAIYDVAGFPSVKGRDLVDALVEQAAPFTPTYLLDQEAQQLSRPSDGRLEVRTAAGTVISCRAVIVTGGIGTFTPRPLPAGADWVGRGLHFFVPRLTAHAGQDVVIVGGGDSACDWVLSLEGIAKSITLVHRRAKFRAHPHTVELVRKSTAEIITDAQVSKILGGDMVEAVEISLADGTAVTRPAQAVIAALGFVANLGPLTTWGVEVVGHRYIPVATTMATNVSGIFAAGDITDYPGKVRLLSVGFGEAAIAVNNAAVLIDPEASLFPGHSSNLP